MCCSLWGLRVRQDLVTEQSHLYNGDNPRTSPFITLEIPRRFSQTAATVARIIIVIPFPYPPPELNLRVKEALAGNFVDCAIWVLFLRVLKTPQ